MKFRLSIAALALFALLAAPAFADFGATIDNSSSFTKEDETDFVQEDTLTVWASALLGQFLRFDAAAQAKVAIDDPHFYADIDKLTLSGDIPAAEPGKPRFAFDLGKFFQSDFSSVVLAQPTAGLRLAFTYPAAQMKLALGYTGLNNKNATSLVVSRLDALDLADDDAYFASPRFIGSATVAFPELFARQSLTLSAIVQEDLRAQFDTVIEEGEEVFNPTGGGTVDTQYWGLGLTGPLASSVYYDLYGYLGTGRTLTFEDDDQSTTGQAYRYEPILAYLFGGSIRYYRPAFYKSSASLKFAFASGDADQIGYLEGNAKGNSGAFIPLAEGIFGLAFTPQISNLVVAELSYSMKPFAAFRDSLVSSLQTGVKVTPFFKLAEGPLSDATVDPSAGSGYLGTELDGIVNLRPYSDLGLGLSLGLFIPNGGAFVDGFDSPWFTGEFTFSFSF